MPMNPNQLATAIHSTVGFPGGPSTTLLGFATGLIQGIRLGITNNPTGTVTGTVPASGGPLADGAATDGLITNIPPTAMASFIQGAAPYPFVSANLLGFCSGVSQHILSAGKVEFETGNITGTCTNTPISPGVLTGAGADGKITGVNGSAMASAVQANAGYPFVSPELLSFCTALAQHIINNAQVTYAFGTVVGTCPAGGGPLAAGTATGGSIL